jgi:hypothetical protein
MKRTYNGLFLSFEDFKNNYMNDLQAWLNKYNNANELLFLQMLKNLYINIKIIKWKVTVPHSKKAF